MDRGTIGLQRIGYDCAYLTYMQNIMRNAGLEEAQAGIKIAGEISITLDMQMASPLWEKVKKN